MGWFGLSDLLRTLPKGKQLVERVKMRHGSDEKIADEKQRNNNMSDSLMHDESGVRIPYTSHE